LCPQRSAIHHQDTAYQSGIFVLDADYWLLFKRLRYYNINIYPNKTFGHKYFQTHRLISSCLWGLRFPFPKLPLAFNGNLDHANDLHEGFGHRFGGIGLFGNHSQLQRKQRHLLIVFLI